MEIESHAEGVGESIREIEIGSGDDGFQYAPARGFHFRETLQRLPPPGSHLVEGVSMMPSRRPTATCSRAMEDA